MKFSKKYFQMLYSNGPLRLSFIEKSLKGIGGIQYSYAHNIESAASFIKSQAKFGQPTSESHKHLLKPGELVPGVRQEEFSTRRKNLVKNIISSTPSSSHVVLVPSATTKYMTEKIPYVFRQNSDFLYLTGCLEPDSVLMLIISADETFESTVFMREKTEHAELWEGPRTGIINAVDFFGVDRARPIGNLLSELLNIPKRLQKFYFWYDFTSPVNSGVHKSVVSFLTSGASTEIKSLKNKIHELRCIKSVSEQNLLRESALVASRGIEKAMNVTKPGFTEHQLFATVDYYCRMHGAEYLAYPPVVATGSNANIIHYINNNQQIQDGDLILMDAGCELHGYCSDITRTWPANGFFTDPQRTLYEIVLNTQLDLIDMCSQRPMTLEKLFDRMCSLLGQRLKEAHVLTKFADSMVLNEVAFKLCPHHVSHYLGMDVHDTGTINRKTLLQNGMAVTIEPGLDEDNFIIFMKRIGLVRDNVLGHTCGNYIYTIYYILLFLS